MNASYSPQKHAAELATYITKLDQQSLEISRLHGKVDRLLSILSRDRDPPAAMDALVAGAFHAMGERVWIVAELLGRSLQSDERGLALCRAIEALGCKPTAKGLGTFLARWIPSGSYVTSDGLELRLCGADSTGRMWVVQRV